MAKAFASGKYALGSCDRCGFTYKLKDLRSQIVNRINSGLLVCGECMDEDHPQLRLGEVDATDAQGLESPSPDSGREESRELSGTPYPADIFQDSP